MDPVPAVPAINGDASHTSIFPKANQIVANKLFLRVPIMLPTPEKQTMQFRRFA